MWESWLQGREYNVQTSALQLDVLQPVGVILLLQVWRDNSIH